MIEGLGQVAEPADAGCATRSEALAPGELEGWMTRLAGTDGAGLPAAGLVDLLDALERAKAACAAAQAKVTAAFIDAQAAAAEQWREQMQACLEGSDFDGYRAAKEQVRRHQFTPPAPPAGGGPGSPAGGEQRRLARRARRGAYEKAGVAAQVGLARRESPHRGARLAATALALVHDLPHTLHALAAGELSERRAELVARLTSHLSAEQRARVDAEAIGANRPDPTHPAGPGDPAGIAGWGDRQLEGTVRAVADRIDAQAAAARARTAETARRVTIRPIPDTMALVTAVLPVKQAVAVYAALTAAAASAQAAGDDRSRGQLMADTLADRLTTTTTTCATCATCGTGGAGGTGPTTLASVASAPAADLPLEVQIVITDRALFNGDDTPAHIPGYGPVPAGWARALLTKDLQPHPSADDTPADDTGPDTAGSPPGRPAAKVWFRRLYTHPATGTLVAMDSRRRLFPAGLRRYLITRDGVCRTPWCEAPIRHADHVTPHAQGGATSAGNGQGLCVRCNQVKEQPGWHAHVRHPGPQATPAAAAPAAETLAASAPAPHTVVITTPTGHTHTSIAPPLLPGHHEPDSASRPGHLRLLPTTPSPLEQLLTERLAS